MAVSTVSQAEALFLEEILRRVALDLTLITDRDIEVEGVEVQRVDARPVCPDRILISFKLAFQVEGYTYHGCMTAPLPDAVALASYLMMVPDERVAARRNSEDLDAATKDALIEVGAFVASAVGSSLSAWPGPYEVLVQSEGCQGVAAGARPALHYADGDPLFLVRAQAKLVGFEAFELVLLLPDVGFLPMG